MSTRLHVGNLAFSVDEAALEAAFAVLGVGTAKVVTRDGRPAGFGFMSVASEGAAAAAIAKLDGTELAGRRISVALANGAAQSRRGGGGGGGNGKGSGGKGSGGQGSSGKGKGGRQRPSAAVGPRAAALEGIEHALNCNAPFDEEMLSGRKSVETREYALPAGLVGVKIALIRCAGRQRGGKGKGKGKGKGGGGSGGARLPQRVVGWIVFGPSARYANEAEWVADGDKHGVPVGHAEYGWNGRPKHGWTVVSHGRLPELAVPATEHHFKSFYKFVFA
jgi:hypothetical protein